jgi:predicted PurR-regulated permease PerM
LGASLSVVLYPIYKWFKKNNIPDWFSSLLTILCFIIILCGPLWGIGVIVFNQAQHVYYAVIHGGNTSPLINSIQNRITSILPQGVTFDINQKIASLVYFLFNNITNVFNTTVSALVSFILIIFSIFYFLKDGEKWKKALIAISPISEKNSEQITTKLSHSINGILRGYLLIALIQGILVSLGFIIFGIPNPALWGVLAGIASLLPPTGTALITVPAIIFLFMTGHTIPAIGLLLWSAILVGTVDNFLNPILVSKRIEIPPFLILFSVLGGISLLGPVGILIGPLVVSLLYTLTSIYIEEFNQS